MNSKSQIIDLLNLKIINKKDKKCPFLNSLNENSRNLIFSSLQKCTKTLEKLNKNYQKLDSIQTWLIPTGKQYAKHSSF